MKELEDKVTEVHREAERIDREYMAKFIKEDLELVAIDTTLFGSVQDEHAVEDNPAELAFYDAKNNTYYDESTSC